MSQQTYDFTATQRTTTPNWWCLPPWHAQVIEWDKKYGRQRADETGRLIGAIPVASNGCLFVRDDAGCSISPEDLRAAAESQLRTLGVWPQNVSLPLDVYTLARNLASEYGSGTPEERACIGLAALNRAKEEGFDSVTHYLTDTGTRRYGPQRGGSNGPNRNTRYRPASTAQDPNVADVLFAALIYDGWTKGWMDDITHGAVAYVDRTSQDGATRKREAERARIVQEYGARSELLADKPPVASGEQVYLAWSSGGDYMTWVGHIPNVRPWRLMLVKRQRDLRGREAARAQIREAGRRAILGQNRQPTPFDGCVSPSAKVIQAPLNVQPPTGVALTSAALPGWAIAGSFFAFAGVIATSLGSVLAPLFGGAPRTVARR